MKQRTIIILSCIGFLAFCSAFVALVMIVVGPATSAKFDKQKERAVEQKKANDDNNGEDREVARKRFRDSVIGKTSSEVAEIVGSPYKLVIAPGQKVNMFNNPQFFSFLYQNKTGKNSIEFVRFTADIAVKVDFEN